MMAQARFVRLEDRGILAVAGADRRSFLQGLVSNDVAKVSSDCAVYAAFLTPQGKYLHDFIMVEHGDEIWLDTERGRQADLRRRLSIYRLRAKVDIAERPELAVAAVFGAAPAAALGLTDEAGAARAEAGSVILVDPRLAGLGCRVVAPIEDLEGFRSGVVPAEFADYDRHRLRLGVPDGSRDLVPEKTILLEAGFDELHGVDWQKGCYIGQELTARTKYRGLIKKRLFPVRIAGEPPPPGAIVTLDGKDAGEMHSSRESAGLATLRLDAVSQERPLAAAGATLEARRPEWMRLEPEAES